MAETFHSKNAALGTTTDTVVHTNSTSNKQIIILCQVANIDGSNSADLYLDYYDQSATSAKALAHTVAVPGDTSINPIGGKLVLEPNDELRAWASAAGDLEIVISYIEIS
tara:strand:- start:364 stop:693 length:330 start_codon:yes stop_codon:yes gene_type:complete